MTLWRVRVTLDDRPGFLAVLAASLALRSVNILAVQVHSTEDGAVDDLILDAPDAVTEAELIAAVQRGRGRDAWAVRADARGLVDPPTQVLGLATRLVQDPQVLGDALQALLDGSVRWLPEAAPTGLGPDRTSMSLPDPAGGTYLVQRSAPVFTPAEYARAQALVALAATADRQAEMATSLLLSDGTELLLRPGEPDDLAAVERMHARCSPQTRRRRYLSGTPGPNPAQLARLLHARHGITLVAATSTGEVVALANLVGADSSAEVALLVEDAWQGRGIGTALLRRLVALGRRSGFSVLSAHTHADNAPLQRTLRRLDAPVTCDRDGPFLTLTMTIAATDSSGAGPSLLNQA